MASSKPGELDEVHKNINETKNDVDVKDGGKAGDVEDTPDDRPDSKTSAAEKRTHDVDDPHHHEQDGGVPDRL